MSDDQGFEKWWSESPDAHRFSTAREKVVTYAAYQAGRESLLGALLELAEETEDLHDASFWSDATQEVIDSLASQEAK